MRIYSVFYISLLESTNSSILIQNKLLRLLLENKYKIKRIKDYNVFMNQYLIKQKNYNKDKNIQKIKNNLTKRVSRVFAQYK